MKKHINTVLKKIIFRLINKNDAKAIITSLVNAKGIDLINLAHQSTGIMKYWDSEVSGESYIIKEVIAKYLDYTDGRKPIIFDVGANVGNYTQELASLYPDVRIFSFEPNPSTFSTLKDNLSKYNNVKSFNFGLGSSKGVLSMYTYDDDLSSEHASILKGVLNDLHNSDKLVEKQVAIETIDGFCIENDVDKIDFLKIDTEGFEYEVLLGAKSLLLNSKIPLIQFEFNEMNVISRVFLKDFYSVLDGYKFFRIDSNSLISLGEYNSRNEIFQFQNILAIHKSISSQVG